MDEWFEPVEQLPNARVRIIFFPHAGAQPQAYFKWAKKLAPHVETYVASYCQRGVRRGLTSPRTLREKVVAMVDALERDVIDIPYALFGHSYGGLLAYEVAREIGRRDRVLPLHIFVSSSSSPVQADAATTAYSQLSDDELYNAGLQNGWFGDTDAVGGGGGGGGEGGGGGASQAAALKSARMTGLKFLKLDLAFYESYQQHDAVTDDSDDGGDDDDDHQQQQSKRVASIGELAQFGATVLRGAEDPSVDASALHSWRAVLAGDASDGDSDSDSGSQSVTSALVHRPDANPHASSAAAAAKHLVVELHEAATPNAYGNRPQICTVEVVAPNAAHFYLDDHPAIVRDVILATLHDIHQRLPPAVFHGPPLLELDDIKFDTIMQDAVAARARAHPDRVAIIDEHTGHVMTYGDLEAEATGLAIWMAECHGCARGRGTAGGGGRFATATAAAVAQGSCWPVAVMLPQDSFYVSMNLAILKIGGALMPFYDNYSDALIAQLLATTHSEIAVCTADNADRFPQQQQQQEEGNVDGTTYDVITRVSFDEADSTAAFPTSAAAAAAAIAASSSSSLSETSEGPTTTTTTTTHKKLFVVDPKDMAQRELLRAVGRDAQRRQAWEARRPHVFAEDAAMLSFTSGSTGTPKVGKRKRLLALCACSCSC